MAQHRAVQDLYTQQNGQYQFWRGGALVYEAPQVGVIIDLQQVLIVAHGPSEAVEKRHSGKPSHVVFFPAIQINAEDLNQCLINQTFLLQLLNSKGIYIFFQ